MITEDIIFHIAEAYSKDIQPDLIIKALHLTLQHLSKTDARTINIVITDNDTVQQLNHQYRGINAPTDVLSFENRRDPDFPDFDQDHLGDIIIAYPVAETQAKISGHTPMEELTLLAVHGALHLLGFDHDRPVNKNKMWATQNDIMVKLGLGHVQPTEN
jgi:probable rRNA maturation factor